MSKGENDDYKIEERYTSELADIASRLDKLRNGRVYELSNVQSDGFIATNVDKLKDQVNKLLGKIQNDGQANDEIFL